MVDAMEKMDAIQNNLDHLKAAQKDAQNIQKEYTRYNQFMLGRKARAYMESGRRTEELKLELEKEESSQELLIQEEREKGSIPPPPPRNWSKHLLSVPSTVCKLSH